MIKDKNGGEEEEKEETGTYAGFKAKNWKVLDDYAERMSESEPPQVSSEFEIDDITEDVSPSALNAMLTMPSGVTVLGRVARSTRVTAGTTLASKISR